MADTDWTQEAGMLSNPDVDNIQDLVEQAETAQTAAETAKTNAAGSATAAASSAASASSSAASASSSATSASSSAAAAQAAQEAIDGLYLGALASDPTVDGNGDPVTEGDWYFNTVVSKAKIYNGSTWDIALTTLVSDTTPQLGANLDTNGNHITFGDDDKAIFGADSDLYVYHDGINIGYIRNDTGDLAIVNTANDKDIDLLSDDGNGNTATYLKCDGSTGSTRLYQSGTQKLYTTSSGVTVNGTVVADGASIDGDITVTGNVDGVDVSAIPSTYVELAGDTMTGKLTLDSDPTSALHAATKQYVDTIAAAGIHYHDPVRVESPTALTVTYDNGTDGVGATLTNADTLAAIVIDGITLSLNDRVLIYTQTDATQNGIYTVTTVGDGSTAWVLTRATDADSYGVSDKDALGEGDAYFVKEGDTGAGELYVMNTSGTITFGTTDITFTQIAETAVYSAGTNLSLDGTTFNLDIPDGYHSLQIGTDDDLNLYHYLGNSYIVNYNGALILNQQNAGGNFQLFAKNSGGTTNAYLELDGATQDVTLSHDGTDRVQLTSTGVNVTGDLDLGDDNKAIFGANEDLTIYRSNGDSHIRSEDGDFYIQQRAYAQDFDFFTYPINAANPVRTMRLSGQSSNSTTFYSQGSATALINSSGIQVNDSDLSWTKVQLGTGPVWELLDEYDANNTVNAIDFKWTKGNYSRIKIILTDVRMQYDSRYFYARALYSNDSGTDYVATNNYRYTVRTSYNYHYTSSSSGVWHLNHFTNMGNSGNEGLQGEFDFNIGPDHTRRIGVDAHYIYNNTANFPYQIHFNGDNTYDPGSSAGWDGIRFYNNSGYIASGNFKVYGIRR